MANGTGTHDLEAVWRAVDGLRAQLQKVSERTAVLASQQSEIKDAVKSVETQIDESEGRMNDRFDRMRNWAIALVGISVPVVSALLGALAQGGGH